MFSIFFQSFSTLFTNFNILDLLSYLYFAVLTFCRFDVLSQTLCTALTGSVGTDCCLRLSEHNVFGQSINLLGVQPKAFLLFAKHIEPYNL